MKRIANALFLLGAVLVTATASKATSPSVEVNLNLTSMPLTFTENQGQWDEQVSFRANAGGVTMWFTKDGAVYQFTRSIARSDTALDDPTDPMNHFRDREPDSIETMMIKASFIGANLDSKMIGLEEMDYKCNYFIGNNPTEWHTDVPNYNAIVYEDIYPGIDLKYYGNGKQMEYDFLVSPGADFSQIQIQYEGALSLSVNEDGELVVETRWNTVTEARPFVYQADGSRRLAVTGQYRLLGDGMFGFELGSEYDSTQAVVIDPTLVYSTYLGGSDEDWGYGIALDAEDCAYVAGWTRSTDFPTQSAYQTEGNCDVFVSKLSSTGNGLVYSTYLGGSGCAYGEAIAVDSEGCAHVTGYTAIRDFPTINAYQATKPGYFYIAAFVTKLNSSGNGLVYSTYLGGSDNDWATGIAVGGEGCAYVTGRTWSTDFPTQNPFQSSRYGDEDAFVTKMSNAGNTLAYSTYLGGGSDDAGRAITVDSFGCAYVTGYTESSDFPTQNQFQTHQGAHDVFVTKLSSSGNNLVYSTYVGGSDFDVAHDIAVDSSGCAHITGGTASHGFPTQNAYQATHQGGWLDAFATKLSGSGNDLVYSTYLGGSSSDGGSGIAVDDSSAAYVTGYTGSSDFPIQNPFQIGQGGNDAFATKLSGSGNNLVYSTYLGGSSYDAGVGIVVDGSGCAYVTGHTKSSDFPTWDGFQANYQGGDWDAFVTKLSLTSAPSYQVTPRDPNPNPPVSQVKQGGEFYRYYVVHNDSGEPVVGAEVEVRVGSESYFFVSSVEGRLTIELVADDLSGVPSEFTATLASVDGHPISPRSFPIRISEREYEREVRFEASGSARVLKNTGVVAERAAGWALMGTKADPDTSLWHRFSEMGVTLGLGLDLGLSVEVNEYDAGGYGGAGLEVGVGQFQEDNHQFTYPPETGIEYSIAPALVLFDPANKVAFSPGLGALIVWLIRTFTSVGDILADSYCAGRIGVDFWGGGGASIVVDGNLLPNGASPTVNLSGSVDGSLHTKLFGSHYSAIAMQGLGMEHFGEVTISGECDFEFEPPEGVWSDAYNVPAWVGFLDNNHNVTYNGTFSCLLEGLTDGSGGLTLVLELTQSPFNSELMQTHRFVITGDESIMLSRLAGCYASSKLIGLVLAGGGASMLLSPVETAALMYCIFGEMGAAQEEGHDITISYEKHSTEIVASYPLGLDLGLIVVSFGVSGEVYREKEILLERGVWISGRAYPLEKYSDDTYTDVVDDVLAVPQALIDNIFSYKGGLDSVFTYYEDTVLAVDTRFQIGGSYLDIPAGALAEGTTIGAYNWSWWGDSSGVAAEQLSDNEYNVSKRFKDQLQENYDLHYGIGGFYNLLPDSLQAGSACTFTIDYLDSEVLEIDESTLRMYFWDDSVKNWFPVGGVVDPDSNWVRADIVSFGNYTLAPTMPGSDFNLIPDSDTLLADGVSVCQVTSDLILNNSGTPVEDGTLITVSTTGGQITTADTEPGMQGTQVATVGGTISFEVQAPVTGWIANVYAQSVVGDAFGWTRIWFADAISPDVPAILGVDSVGANAVELTWSRVSETDLIGYRVYYDTDTVQPWDGESPYDSPSPLTVGLDTARVLRLWNCSHNTYWAAVSSVDMSGNESALSVPVSFIVDFVCGDIDASDGIPDISDLVYLIDYMFQSGPEPVCMEAADVNGSGGVIDISDLVYLIDYMFLSGQPPECP